MSGKHDSIAVEIYGQTYNVRGEGDPAYLLELARFVDARMREIAGQVSTVDPVKIAILAALNIADELSRSRKRYDDETGTWMEKAEEMVERLGRTLIDEPSKGTTSV